MFFYFWLLLKKIRTRIHNIFEIRQTVSNIITPEDFSSFCISYIDRRLKKYDEGIYYSTKVMNNNSPMTLAQTRVILAYCNIYNTQKKDKNLIFKINQLSKFIISTKGENGIYKFNQKSWNLQDEGIASIWVLLALLEVYKISKDEDLLKNIIETIESVNSLLFSKQNSLVHTLGDDYWCLNAASTYAWFVSELLPFYRTDELVENCIISIELCNSKFSEKGFFPYSERRQGTYLLLYNPVVIYSLEKAIKNENISKELKENTSANLKSARNFLLKQLDKDNFFVEPEMKVFSRYVISNILSMVVLKGYTDKNTQESILNNILSYVINSNIYLCRDENGKYFNGNLYEVKDVLLTEVFYWFTVYNT